MSTLTVCNDNFGGDIFNSGDIFFCTVQSERLSVYDDVSKIFTFEKLEASTCLTFWLLSICKSSINGLMNGLVGLSSYRTEVKRSGLKKRTCCVRKTCSHDIEFQTTGFERFQISFSSRCFWNNLPGASIEEKLIHDTSCTKSLSTRASLFFTSMEVSYKCWRKTITLQQLAKRAAIWFFCFGLALS